MGQRGGAREWSRMICRARSAVEEQGDGKGGREERVVGIGRECGGKKDRKGKIERKNRRKKGREKAPHALPGRENAICRSGLSVRL